MPHNEFQSVSRMKENFTSGLTGRDWKSVYDLVNKSLRNRKGGATGYQVYEIRRQSFTLLPLLAQILAEAIQQVAQLQSIIGNGKDSLNFMRDINQGMRDAMRLQQTMNRSMKSGNWNLGDVNDILHQMEELYGKIPMTAEAKTQSTHDMTVAESIQLHNDAFRYADEVDPEAERMKQYAEQASPQGAAKASLQAQGVTIHVLNQLLRTNAALLKVQSEQLAMGNRKSKMQSDQFRQQYTELGRVLGDSKGGYELPSLSDAR